MKPNKRNICKWVEALRSGNYEQTDGALANDRDDGKLGYCCLGVACDISGLVPLRLGDDACYYFGNEAGVLPVEVQDWLGLHNSNPSVAGYALSSWNDNNGKTFDEIADLIEAEYLTA